MTPNEPNKMQHAAGDAIKTAKTATTLAKAHLIRESRKHGGRWQWVDFPGPHGRESAGIVDIVAIRKRWAVPVEPEFAQIKHLDLFDIMLIQVKGGSARMPTIDDISRMEQVADHYGAGAVGADYSALVDFLLAAAVLLGDVRRGGAK